MARAISYIGSTDWGQRDATYCETFVECVTDCGWQGASALDAWHRNSYRQRTTGDLGDAVYFDADPENGGYGHTGIVTGPDCFTSVTYSGVQEYRITGWRAPLLGYIRYWREA